MTKKRRSRAAWTLALLAAVLFLGGYALLYALSGDGKLFLARYGIVFSRDEVTESISLTLRNALRRLGVPTGSQVLAELEEEDGTRIQWKVILGPRASFIQVNAAITEAIERKGGRVFDAWEAADREVGTRVTMDVGIGRLHTHEVVLLRKAGGTGEEVVRLGLILEGFGRDDLDSLATIALDLPFAFSGAVLTNGSDPKGWSRKLIGKERETLAQVAMEPMNYPKENPGKNPILVDMSSGRIRRIVHTQLGIARDPVAFLPYMGGMALQDDNVMEAIMQELGGREVAYLEPSGKVGSVGIDVAARAGVPFLRIDTHLNPGSGTGKKADRELLRRLREVSDTARRRGFATCLARITPSLLETLEREVPRLEKQGVRFVPVSSLLRPSAI